MKIIETTHGAGNIGSKRRNIKVALSVYRSEGNGVAASIVRKKRAATRRWRRLAATKAA